MAYAQISDCYVHTGMWYIFATVIAVHSLGGLPLMYIKTETLHSTVVFFSGFKKFKFLTLGDVLDYMSL